MFRRDATQSIGFVQFPTQTIPNTGEGGMVVKLYVLVADGQEMCCGDAIVDTYVGEILLGICGGNPMGDLPNEPDIITAESLCQWQKERSEVRRQYSEQLFCVDDQGLALESSLFCKAAIVMGSTGWSAHWVCQFEDLTEDGQKLVEMMRKMYPGSQVLLATFLDT